MFGGQGSMSDEDMRKMMAMQMLAGATQQGGGVGSGMSSIAQALAMKGMQRRGQDAGLAAQAQNVGNQIAAQAAMPAIR